MTERAHHEYQDGPWTAVAGTGFLALVEPDAPWRLVDGLWQVARGDGDVLGALGVVAADGFAALPRFAIVRTDADGSVHAVLRGPVRLRLHGADGVQEVAARDGAVWTEHRALGARGLEVVVEDAPDATWWPLVGGVVRAGGLRTGTTDVAEAVPDTATHEQPVVAPALEPTDAAPLAEAPGWAQAETAAEVEPVAAAEPVLEVEPVADAERVVAGEPVAEAELEVLGERPDEAEPGPVTSDVAPASVPQDPFAQDAFAAPAPVDDADLLASSDPATVDLADTTGAPVDQPVPADLLAAPVPVAAEHVATPAPAAAPTPQPASLPDIPWWPLAPATGADDDVTAPLPPLEPEPDDPAEPGSDDHDGMTILSSDLARLRDRLPAWSQDPVPGPFPTPGSAPLPARMVLSTGLVVSLDRAVLLGRAPQVARVTNRELPRLVTVPSPNQDISRTHAEVRTEGEHVVVTDLDSTNGVHVSRPGEGVRRLHPGEPSVVGTDEVVDLGDGVTFTVERSAS